MNISPDAIKDAVQAVGSIRKAEVYFKEQGIDVSERTLRRILKKAVSSEIEEFEGPAEIDIEELLARRARVYEAKKANKEAQRVVTRRLKLDGPFAVAFPADCHLDADGSDVSLAFSHADLLSGVNTGIYGINLGDIWNNWSGRLARLWADQTTNGKEAQALVRAYLERVQWLAFQLGNHDCLDEETEVFTQRGWLRHTEIQDGDMCLGLTPDAQEVQWQPIIAQVSRPAEEILELNSKGINLAATANHRVLRAKNKQAEFDYTTLDQLENTVRFPVSGKMKTKGVSLSSSEVALAGWMVTDASLDVVKNKVIFYQSKDTSKLIALLNDLNIPFTHFIRDKKVNEIAGRKVKSQLPAQEFHINQEHSLKLLNMVSSREKLPSWVWDMSREQFVTFINAVIDGDGTRTKHGRSAVIYKTKGFLDELMSLCALHGWCGWIKEYRPGHFKLNVTERTTISFYEAAKRIERKSYNGLVWCLSVPLTNFFVRRNGMAHFTGNCWSPDRSDIVQEILKNAKVPVAKHQMRLEIQTPSGRPVRIMTRHEHPRNSMWNVTHGVAQKAMLDGWANIYIGGHKHVSGYQHGWHDGFSQMWHAVQVASYKKVDDFAEEIGLPPCDLYCCPVAIINPYAQSEINFIRWEFDPFEAVERLKWERKRWMN